VRCGLIPLLLLLLLFHLSFILHSTLTWRTANCADAQGRRPRRSGAARGEDVICVLERLEHRKPTWAKSSCQEKRGSDERAQARQIARAESRRVRPGATTTSKTERETLK
jgi:hypothetical protein